MNLFFRESGKGQPLIILHGLFGSSDNWYTLSKVFAGHFRVFAIDQRNHGQSPHHEEHDYKVLTQDLEDFISSQGLQQPVILGHSMGGKTAMNFALKNPSLLVKLVVVDIMPKAYPLHHDHILTGMNSIPLGTLQSRGEADQILQRTVPDVGERQFLLKNLSRSTEGQFEWKINLPVLEKNIDLMGAELQFGGQFTGPTLFVKGARSKYFAAGDEKNAERFFPNTKWVTLDTGHWVQAEKPQEFAQVVLDFLSEQKA